MVFVDRRGVLGKETLRIRKEMVRRVERNDYSTSDYWFVLTVFRGESR